MTDFTETNPDFDAWVAALPEKHWAKYDLSACRLGWEACIAFYQRRILELMEPDDLEALQLIDDIEELIPKGPCP